MGGSTGVRRRLINSGERSDKLQRSSGSIPEPPTKFSFAFEALAAMQRFCKSQNGVRLTTKAPYWRMGCMVQN